ncbi:hypothetical protein Q7P35_008613 [Cladosporium inversicolor]
MSNPSKPIKRVLVANRGEIATRILATARELNLETFTVYTDTDTSHTHNHDAAHALRLPSPASYTDIPFLVSLAQRNSIDAVHPGYGFLSENATFAAAMRDAGIEVIGPGAEILERTGDKLAARVLAEESGVPVLPALTVPTNKVEDVRLFAEEAGLPVMVKAVDGGGGRGIRLVRELGELEGLVRRAVEESPQRLVFAEKAAVEGWRHVEVQVLGDGVGGVRHLWERECSIQRRYQKVVELAVSTVGDRGVVGEVIGAAVRMAEKIRYKSLGTFEFLVNPASGEFYFLEINPRLQVEHTITESICSMDIVKIQFQLAQGLRIDQTDLADIPQDPIQPPPLRSIQLRVTAEDPEKNYSLSVGKIQSFHFPSGNGIRVDTALVHGVPASVGPDFDSVIAKIIITARTWDDAVTKGIRAVQDTSISGIKTNLDLLAAILAHPDFLAGNCDTQWLEANHADLIALSHTIRDAKSKAQSHILNSQPNSSISATANSSSGPLFRPKDAWTLSLTPKNQSSSSAQQHHLSLTKILRNDFPASLSAEITHTGPSSTSQSYTLSLNSTSSSASARGHRLGSPSDPSHVLIPFAGTLVEVLVDEGDEVAKGDVVCVVRQMKMELEVRAPRSGIVGFVMEVEDGGEVSEGMLAATVVEGERARL